MGTEATGLSGKKPPSLPLPPALFLVRARSRQSRVVDLDDDDGAAASRPATPPLRPPVTVPFLWEEAPGKPKQPSDTAAGTPPPDAATAATARSTVLKGGAATATFAAASGGDEKAGRVPLKLPPRLQVPTSAAAADSSLSPKTVLHGPYGCTGGGAKRPPRALRRTGSGATTFRRTPSAAAGGFFSRRKAAAATWSIKKGGHERDAAAPDGSCSSPAASSVSSSSSSSAVSCFGDDHGRGALGRLADGRAESSEDESGKGSVRITRFRRNRSLPSMTTSHLWASIRKSVKQISPWS